MLLSNSENITQLSDELLNGGASVPDVPHKISRVAEEARGEGRVTGLE
jgi:hypothetical protein